MHENIIISHEIMHYMNRKKGKLGFMALKIDMAKAYDKVEWPLLFSIMKHHGFCEKFLALIAKYISSSSFSILDNSYPFGSSSPTRVIFVDLLPE